MKQQEYLYNRVMRYVTDLIKQHLSEPNYKLPSEKQLEIKLGVSNITVKTALSKLESEGLIVRYQGKGTFINPLINKQELDTPFYNIVVCLLAFSTYFVREIILGINDVCQAKNMNFFCYQSFNNSKTETKLIKSLSSSNYDGMIIFPSNESHYNKNILQLHMNNYPMVIIDRSVQDVNISFVSSDHYKSTYDTIIKLIDEGYKKIAIILPSTQNVSSINDRYRGYVDAHIKKGIKIYSDYIINKYTLSDNTDFIKAITYPFDSEEVNKWANEYASFLEKHSELDAIITINGISFLGLIKAAKLVKDKLGKTFRIITYDNDYNDVASLIDIPFETIKQNGYEIGRQAAEQLYNLITGSEKHKKILID